MCVYPVSWLTAVVLGQETSYLVHSFLLRHRSWFEFYMGCPSRRVAGRLLAKHYDQHWSLSVWQCICARASITWLIVDDGCRRPTRGPIYASLRSSPRALVGDVPFSLCDLVRDTGTQ